MTNTYKLTARDLEVLTWSSLGKTQEETAEILGISTGFVGVIKSRIYDKLGTFNLAGTIGFCFRHGILSVPDRAISPQDILNSMEGK